MQGKYCVTHLAIWLSACGGALAADPFVDMTQGSGLDFVHFNGMSGELYYAEMMGSGVALIDYDNDGDLDVYLVQGKMLGPEPGIEDAVFSPEHDLPLSDRLYRNDLSLDSDGEAVLRFTDVTDDAKLNATGYGMGVAAADYDRDGWVDLYVTNFGANQLLRNNGDGTFSDQTEFAGVGDEAWGVSASFVDYDLDGLVDLYVGNYVDYTVETSKPCRSTTSARDYCSPKVYKPQFDTLYRNLGNGRFADVSLQAGIRAEAGGALGVIATDFNGDGFPDIYVANDGVPNLMWINDGEGAFEDLAYLAGVAVNLDGAAEASMGVDAADFDNDGDQELFMTHLARETNTLYVNDGEGWFEDRTAAAGLAAASYPRTGFGTRWLDYDNDGQLDLVIANGGVTHDREQADAGDPYPMKQRNQLFKGLGEGRYEDVSDEAGAAFAAPGVGRGLALGDVDNDGDSDVLISNSAGPARLLINNSDTSRWIGFSLSDAWGQVTGATVVLKAERTVLIRRAYRDGSYASSSDPRILIGIGETRGPYELEVIWPDLSVERWNNLEPGRYHELTKGKGAAPQ